ncbi:hypothetical protein TKK_0000585 [Trichogramma kaykai]|uniref:Fas-binding factor 1 C-terminal domain-containing protein n=1 Tax=Trichogramma kaykai TaxID=54128 RepID=A0ABD2VZQ4_9HYME
MNESEQKPRRDDKPSTTPSVDDKDERSKKKVFFRDSSVDDPLTDLLLSDKESSEDEDAKKYERKAEITEETAKLSKSDDKQETKMKSLFDDMNDDDDYLTKTTTSSAQSKKSLMEDLFGSSRSKSSPDLRKKNLFDHEMPAAPMVSSSTRTIPRETTMTTSSRLSSEIASKGSSGNVGFSLSAGKEPRRGRRATPQNNDPLGLLSAPLLVDDTLKIEEKSSAVKIVEPGIGEARKEEAVTVPNDDLPEWLGGPPKLAGDKEAKLSGLTDQSTTLLATSSSVLADSSRVNDATASKLLAMEFDQRAALVGMQQQEHELRTALALSQQSGKLNGLLAAQRAKLAEQESQFDALLARQCERQATMEAQIRAQQERIDSYIGALASQPEAGLTSTVDQELRRAKETTRERDEREAELQKLKLEKSCLECTLESLKDKHEKETTMLEDSYKKQITFLEEQMVQMEKRMMDDVECIEADYKLKIQKLKEEMTEIEADRRAERDRAKAEHAKLIAEMQDRHFKNVDLLQREHLETIERLTRTKESERRAINTMTQESTNVQNILNKSQVIVEGLEGMQKKFQSRDERFDESRDHHYSMLEKNIEYLKEQLEKQREAFSEEKKKLTATIEKLETEISQLMLEFHKQNASLKETEELYRSKEQALLRDREILVDQTNWERERIQAMREAWAKEQNVQMQWLAQERQTIAAERGKLQIFDRLKIGENESSKAELEATIKAAQDAKACANQERLKWREKIAELDAQASEIREKEARLVQKARELQQFTQSAVAKRDEGLQALKQARFIEERYKEKLGKLQIQEDILTQKESQIAIEKLQLAKDRLSIHINEAEKPEDALNRANAKTPINHETTSYYSQFPGSSRYSHKDIIDPQLILLKYELDNKLQMRQGSSTESCNEMIL